MKEGRNNNQKKKKDENTIALVLTQSVGTSDIMKSGLLICLGMLGFIVVAYGAIAVYPFRGSYLAIWILLLSFGVFSVNLLVFLVGYIITRFHAERGDELNTNKR